MKPDYSSEIGHPQEQFVLDSMICHFLSKSMISSISPISHILTIFSNLRIFAQSRTITRLHGWPYNQKDFHYSAIPFSINCSWPGNILSISSFLRNVANVTIGWPKQQRGWHWWESFRCEWHEWIACWRVGCVCVFPFISLLSLHWSRDFAIGHEDSFH